MHFLSAPIICNNQNWTKLSFLGTHIFLTFCTRSLKDTFPGRSEADLSKEATFSLLAQKVRNIEGTQNRHFPDFGIFRDSCVKVSIGQNCHFQALVFFLFFILEV